MSKVLTHYIVACEAPPALPPGHSYTTELSKVTCPECNTLIEHVLNTVVEAVDSHFPEEGNRAGIQGSTRRAAVG